MGMTNEVSVLQHVISRDAMVQSRDQLEASIERFAHTYPSISRVLVLDLPISSLTSAVPRHHRCLGLKKRQLTSSHFLFGPMFF